MPDIFRLPLRMDCLGLNLAHPLDRMPKSKFAYLFNARSIVAGTIEGRPGYSSYLSCAPTDLPNSVRRLNDSAKLYAPLGFAYVGGAGSNLYVGTPGNYVVKDTGYSGHPLSLITFHPNGSPESWMYVYDENKSVKVRADGTLREIGVAPPTTAPLIDYATPAWVSIRGGQTATGFIAGGGASAPTLTDREAGAAATIGSIIYNVGTTGWACIVPNSATTAWASERMGIVINTGGGTQETCIVREIHPTISATTIGDITYDLDGSGNCSLTLVGSPTGLERNSLITIQTELVRILEVVFTPDSVSYSIRCNTVGRYGAGDTVLGNTSWYVFALNTHAAGEGIATQYIGVTQGTASKGYLYAPQAVNAAIAGGRPIDTANDYLHISVFLATPANAETFQIMLPLDASPTWDFASPGNALMFEIAGDQLIGAGASGGSWAEILVPLSSGTRTGSDSTRTLANVAGIALQLTTTGACNWGFDWAYLFGTYGPTVIPNSPVGLQYQCAYRDSHTLAHSVPGPLTRYQLFPLREGVIITPTSSMQAGVDQIDAYRLGAAVSTPLYVGSIINSSAIPANFIVDAATDASVLSTNQAPDLTSLQPWPLLDVSWNGTCDVIGTTVIWKTGSPFKLALLSNSVILIDGLAFQTYGQPRSTTELEITQSGGDLADVPFEIGSPTLAGQPLPFAFGALEGPFAPVVFALGDPLNGGNLYYCDFSDADAAADTNVLELAPPGQDLVSGAVWKGMAFAGNREELFVVRFSYLATIGAASNNSYQWAKVNAPSGIWSRWACCSTPIGVAYLGRDGIYVASDTQAVNITDDDLYPMFPHDGQKAASSMRGQNTVFPVDMAQVDFLRLSYLDQTICFAYRDSNGEFNTLLYDIVKKAWFLNNYHDNISFQYLAEGDATDPSTEDIVALDVSAAEIVLIGGTTDGGSDINTLILTPSLDNGDERTQKLYVDMMTMADGTGAINLALTYDSAKFFSPISTLAMLGPGVVQQFQTNIDSLDDLSTHLNVGVKFAWVGGPSGPRLYACEVSGYNQPYLCQRLVTQFTAFSFPGWKHIRRMYPALISTDVVTITIATQDGRTFGPYTLDSTGGRYKIVPQMVDHGLKDLAFALQLDGNGKTFSPFIDDFTIEVKEWTEETYIKLAVFKA